jgi:trehalose 6-phosphate phosphatase
VIPVLSPEGDALIAEAAREPALLVFDFDGTLAPIVADPARAALRPVTHGLLRLAALLFPAAVVSGRDRSDVVHRVASAALVEVVGNHGAEGGTTPAAPTMRARVRAWSAALESALRGIPGVSVEPKSLSVAIHHRGAGLARDQVERIAALAGSLPGSRVFGGHDVVNVVPSDAPTKGDAVEDIARRHGRGTVLFLGDDVTDEDAFRSPVVTFPIRVGRSEHSAARWFVDDQLQVDALLRALVRARARQDGLGDRWHALVDVLEL